jgi:hypothetical protein
MNGGRANALRNFARKSGGTPLITLEETLLILGKWRDEKSPVHVVANLAYSDFGFDARIIEVSEGKISLDLQGQFDVCFLSILDFAFDYAEPKELAKWRFEGRTYLSGLSATGPFGEYVAILEIAEAG